MSLFIFSGEVSTLAGGKETGYVDGKGEDARFKVISGLCYDEVDECLLVCDYGNNKLRRVALNGTPLPPSSSSLVVNILFRRSYYSV